MIKNLLFLVEIVSPVVSAPTVRDSSMIDGSACMICLLVVII
jgi:hypothetical protein